MLLEEKEIFRILDRKVFFARQSTKKEQTVFPNGRKGGFFTFALESGQKFVANFSEEVQKQKKKRRMTFRPLNNMMRGLKEFSWISSVGTLLPTIEEEYKFSDNASSEQKRAIMYLLKPDRVGDQRRGGNISLMEKASLLLKAYFEEVEAHEKLQQILIPEIQKQKNMRR